MKAIGAEKEELKGILPVGAYTKLDKGKPPGRKDKVLFIDARQIFTQVDRAHREFVPAQIEFIANIVRLQDIPSPKTPSPRHLRPV